MTDQASNCMTRYISQLMCLRLTQKIILLSGWLTSSMCMGKFKLPMISSDNTNPVWRRLKVFSFLSRQWRNPQIIYFLTDAEYMKQQEVWYLKSVFIEDNIFIHILFTILKNKTKRRHLNKISHRETTEQNMGRPTLIQK